MSQRITSIAVMIACLVTLTGHAESIQTSISEHGTLKRGDHEVFPFGIYHVAWIGERYGNDRFNDMIRIHENGLEIMSTSLDPSSRESALELLDGAAQRDMGIMVELYLPALGLLIDLMKDSPAVVSWQIGDDFNVTNSQNYCSPQLLRERNILAKKHDPNHVTYASGGSALVPWYRSFKDYHGCVDMIGIQCYPVDNKPDFPDRLILESSFQLLKARVKELEGSGIVPIANLQSFSWKEKGVFPTPSESRNMLYGALSAGVKGVLYYTYYDGKNIKGNITLDTQAPDLWREIGRQAQEIKLLEPFLLSGTRQDIPSDHKNLHITMWTLMKSRILVVFNTDRKVSLSVNNEIPSSSRTQLYPMFANRPSGLKLTNKKLQGSVEPDDVHVYTLSTTEQSDREATP